MKLGMNLVLLRFPSSMQFLYNIILYSSHAPRRIMLYPKHSQDIVRTQKPSHPCLSETRSSQPPLG